MQSAVSCVSRDKGSDLPNQRKALACGGLPEASLNFAQAPLCSHSLLPSTDSERTVHRDSPSDLEEVAELKENVYRCTEGHS